MEGVGDTIVFKSLAAGSMQAKVQLDVIQETSFSLNDDKLAYLVFFFYLTERLRLVSDTLEEQSSDEKVAALRAFVEKKARKDHDAISERA